MVSVLLQFVVASGAERAEQTHHVVVIFRRRRSAAENPIEQIGVGAIEQRFEPIELGIVQALERRFRERAEDEITLLRPAMPASEEQPPTAHFRMFGL